MATPIDYQPQTLTKRRIPRWPFIVAICLAVGVLLFRPVLTLLMSLAFAGSSKTLSSADTAHLVATSLMHWEIFGKFDRNPDYTKALSSLATGIRGINGFTESDGFHGDGTDWYEVELSPDLADKLRATLQKSPNVQKTNYFPDNRSAPPWWPKQWPPDAECYQRASEYFVLPATGTRAWFKRVRT